MKKIVVMSLLLLLVSVTQAQEEWCVSVWYPSSDYPGGNEAILAHSDLINEVNPFWYSPLPDGQLNVHDGAEDAEQLDAWREAGLQIIPSIFSSIATMIEDDASRDNHISAIVDTVERMNYDGIDIDYEGFPANTRENFSLFVEGLAEALHANERILSVTVHAKTADESTFGGAQAQDWEQITSVADIFRIMTYDYTNRNQEPGPIAPPSWILDVLAYADSVTDISKVQMGLHFYGYSWQRGTPPATTVSWMSINNWVESFDLEFERDPADMEARLEFKATGLPRQFITIADPIGLDFKLNQVMTAFPDLGGVSIWGIGGEHPDLWTTLETYTEGCRT